MGQAMSRSWFVGRREKGSKTDSDSGAEGKNNNIHRGKRKHVQPDPTATAPVPAPAASSPGCPRPRSPPRGLSSILRSPSFTHDFRAFLADLDEAADEDGTRVRWLDFVFSCRVLDGLLSEAGGDARADPVTRHLDAMGRDYFPARGGHRLALSNPVIWTACQNLCSSASASASAATTRSDFDALWKAHDDVVQKLDAIHQPFLLEQEAKRAASGRSKVLANAVMCLL